MFISHYENLICETVIMKNNLSHYGNIFLVIKSKYELLHKYLGKLAK